jgi:hypothetical protein
MFQPRFGGDAIRSLGGMPEEALDALVAVMAAVCADPYDRLHSMPVSSGDHGRRLAELGDDSRFIEFRVDEPAKLIHVYAFVWTD